LIRTPNEEEEEEEEEEEKEEEKEEEEGRVLHFLATCQRGSIIKEKLRRVKAWIRRPTVTPDNNVGIRTLIIPNHN
jgi:hypothetical protein